MIMMVSTACWKRAGVPILDFGFAILDWSLTNTMMPFNPKSKMLWPATAGGTDHLHYRPTFKKTCPNFIHFLRL
jgi:hypothetical protein